MRKVNPYDEFAREWARRLCDAGGQLPKQGARYIPDLGAVVLHYSRLATPSSNVGAFEACVPDGGLPLLGLAVDRDTEFIVLIFEGGPDDAKFLDKELTKYVPPETKRARKTN